MPTHIITFNVVQFLASCYACRRGGGPERAVGLLLLIAGATSIVVPRNAATNLFVVNSYMLSVDAMLMVALTAVALVANRYWPIWIAAVQLVTLAAHGARAWDQTIWARAYGQFTGKIAYVCIALLVIGTLRHRARLAEGFPERGWSWSPRISDDGVHHGRTQPGDRKGEADTARA